MALLAISTTVGAYAYAENYPDHPIKLLVGFSAGSGNDTAGRIVGEILTEQLGQPAVVENKTGANGSLAVQTVAKAKPDGYTLLVSNTSSITVNPLINKDIAYDPERDLEPITTLLGYPLVLTINATAEKTKNVRTVKDLVELAKSQKEPLTYGSAGIGNLFHIAGALFVKEAGIEATHIPYRGGTPMRVALLSGEIDFAFNTLDTVPLVKDGRVRALAVTEHERWRDLPDVPTMDEVGLPSIYISPWFGVFAPKGTPPDVLSKLNDALSGLSTNVELRKKLEAIGRVEINGPKAFAEKIKKETAINKEIIAREGIAAR
ncbi:Bug family tripartite tricarboxylate transporter substrate binding protein [Bordetella tumulicola]|uniref:Bug family tripartite tricarboxylate transporter substrate binding protein n=1 Tax=Bordetella tumulicola TaxID=1649133 RepID=UPI0039F09B3C